MPDHNPQVYRPIGLSSLAPISDDEWLDAMRRERQEEMERLREMRRTWVTCRTCGGEMRRADVEGPDTCTTCMRRIEQAIESRANGGRRFGIEIEVEWDAAGDDYCDDPYCEECRCRGVPDARTIANAIDTAGVPCVNIGYTHEVVPDAWKVVSDGSLNYGWEIVSPPMQWAQADQIRTVCRVLSELGAEPTEQCGLHVHHDVGDIDLDGMRKLLGHYTDWQHHTDALCASYRANGEWCSHYHPHDLRYLDRERSNYNTVHQLTYNMERYLSLNVSCFPAYGTVEMRQHESTLNPEEIMAWVAYGQALIDAALSDDPNVANASDTEEMIDALPIPTSRARRLTAPTIRDRLKEKAARAQRQQRITNRRPEPELTGDFVPMPEINFR